MSKLVYALSHLSFYKHCLEVSVIARYGFNVCNCKPESINGKDAEMTGISDRLRAFTQFWLSSYSNSDPDGELVLANQTSTKETQTDLFQIFAKQISLFNTYGIEVKSCKDVQPFQLHDLSIAESDLSHSFVALIMLLILMKILLFITVKLVIRLRTSL